MFIAFTLPMTRGTDHYVVVIAQRVNHNHSLSQRHHKTPEQLRQMTGPAYLTARFFLARWNAERAASCGINPRSNRSFNFP